MQSSTALHETETVSGIVLCYSHQACCLLCYLCEITSNKMMAFTFTFLGVIMVSDLKKNVSGSTDLAKKKRQESADLHTLFTPLLATDELRVVFCRLWSLV